MTSEIPDQEETNYNWLTMMTTVATRHALACGMSREFAADCLRSLADAIADPTSVAENMSPLTQDMIDVTGWFQVATNRPELAREVMGNNEGL